LRLKIGNFFTIIKGIQSFFGFCNFYRRFIRDYGRITKLLNYLIRRDFTFNFDEKWKAFFEKLKNRLCTVLILRYYDPELECILETDISDGIIAAVLFQFHPDGEWYPVNYFFKDYRLCKAELPDL